MNWALARGAASLEVCAEADAAWGLVAKISEKASADPEAIGASWSFRVQARVQVLSLSEDRADLSDPGDTLPEDGEDVLLAKRSRKLLRTFSVRNFRRLGVSAWSELCICWFSPYGGFRARVGSSWGFPCCLRNRRSLRQNMAPC